MNNNTQIKLKNLKRYNDKDFEFYLCKSENDIRRKIDKLNNNISKLESIDDEEISEIPNEIVSCQNEINKVISYIYDFYSTKNSNLIIERDNYIANYKNLDMSLSSCFNQLFIKYLDFSNKKINDLKEKSASTEEKISKISNNMIFNIASVFLGISAVSAMVTGMQYIPSELLLSYFGGFGFIIISIFAIIAIFFNKIDIKAIIISFIAITYIIVFYSYSYNAINNYYNKNYDSKIYVTTDNKS